MKSLTIATTLLSLTMGLSNLAFAATIQNVKGAKALLVLDGDEVSVGDELFSVDENGKKKALLRITQVKNGKALSEIVKGKPEIGQSTISRSGGSSKSSEEQSSSAEPSSTRSRANGKSWGLLGSLESDTMSASFTSGSQTFTANMTGSAYGVYGYYDHPLTTNWQARATVGIQMFSTAGSISTAACAGGSKNCTVDIMYMSGMGSAKYNINLGSNKLWLGGGFAFLIPASKSSNVLDTGGISTNQLYAFQAGFDVKMGSKHYLPLMFEYGLFPSSSSVTASVISLRAGWAWNL